MKLQEILPARWVVPADSPADGFVNRENRQLSRDEPLREARDLEPTRTCAPPAAARCGTLPR